MCERVAALPVYQAACVIHCYLPIRSEVDTTPLISHALAHGKRVVVPVVQPGTGDLAHTWLNSLAEDDMQPGIFGTLQPRTLCPVTSAEWDLVLVPLLAFDRGGYRLGYGKGFYDRLLTMSPVPSVGLAFAIQEATEGLPHEGHDIPLEMIVTEHERIMVPTITPSPHPETFQR